MTDTQQAIPGDADLLPPPSPGVTVRTNHRLDRARTTERRRGWMVWRRMTWWMELAIVAACYVIYDSSRTLASSEKAPAVAHGLQILNAERWVHLDPEATLNRLLSSWDWLSDLAGYYYSTLHFIITPLVLIYLWSRRPEAYPRLRSALVMATAMGLFVFIVWPVAPPRFTVPGLTDTLVQHHVMGMSNGHGVSSLINQYAAMPSLHVGWALWCAVAVVVTHRSRWRHLAWLYPITTTMVVLTTANHYLFDAFGGAAVIFVALAIAYAPRRARRAERWSLNELAEAR